jgi:hypothetical protein
MDEPKQIETLEVVTALLSLGQFREFRRSRRIKENAYANTSLFYEILLQIAKK